MVQTEGPDVPAVESSPLLFHWTQTLEIPQIKIKLQLN